LLDVDEYTLQISLQWTN